LLFNVSNKEEPSGPQFYENKSGEKIKNLERASLFKIKINMESQFYQINILKLFFKWKWHLVIIIILAVILTAIFSGPFFITPKFKSFAVMYPANIAPYSDESETEQMLQIIQSREITDNVINKFNLAEHYEIDTSYEYYYTTMMWEYSQNVHISKTPYEGVLIEVLDKDPQIACDMVNSMIDFYNIKVRNMHEIKFGEVVAMYKRAMFKKEAYLDSLENRLYELSTKYGLLDYESQSREITRGFLRTVDGGSSNINTREVLKLKENIEKRGGELIKLKELIEFEAEDFVLLKQLYEQAVMDYDRKYTYVNMITDPYTADKKSFPVRWLIVVISSLASFFLAFIVILIIENYKGLSKSS